MHNHEGGATAHGDVKMENILLCPGGHFKLCDLGAAESEDGSSTRSVMSKLYVSPERMESETGRATCSSDVWALGIVLHWLLFGEPPFKSKSLLKLGQEISSFRVSMIGTSCGEEERALLIRMLDPNPETRVTSSQLCSFGVFRSQHVVHVACLFGVSSAAGRVISCSVFDTSHASTLSSPTNVPIHPGIRSGSLASFCRKQSRVAVLNSSAAGSISTSKIDSSTRSSTSSSTILRGFVSDGVSLTLISGSELVCVTMSDDSESFGGLVRKSDVVCFPAASSSISDIQILIGSTTHSGPDVIRYTISRNSESCSSASVKTVGHASSDDDAEIAYVVSPIVSSSPWNSVVDEKGDAIDRLLNTTMKPSSFLNALLLLADHRLSESRLRNRAVFEFYRIASNVVAAKCSNMSCVSTTADICDVCFNI
ncbi:putative Protein kinase domain containing protein [Blattamonas nauphoetae]|uniref:non-specific serine/threonine protein kinase n=1 Tax=Blattamonas nauphoetae TaxID=2049346 RepID=A0ABQ9XLW1_9EUKA|nr:putative Protein kinase domain containing protein [Blattamonas nauphoetae]